jgi:hypothetical protein
VSALYPLTPEQLAKAEERLRNPKPGSRIEAAQKYGIDLSLVIDQLRLTPAQRARKFQRAVTTISRFRGVARRPASWNSTEPFRS